MRGQAAEARAPKCSASRQRDESLRCGAVLIPILLVVGRTRPGRAETAGPNRAELSDSVMPGYCGAKSRSAAAPAIGTIRSTRKCAALGVQPAVRFPDVVFKRDGIARLGVQIVRGPLIQRDAVGLEGRLEVERRHHRIGNLAAADRGCCWRDRSVPVRCDRPRDCAVGGRARRPARR